MSARFEFKEGLRWMDGYWGEGVQIPICPEKWEHNCGFVTEGGQRCWSLLFVSTCHTAYKCIAKHRVSKWLLSPQQLLASSYFPQHHSEACWTKAAEADALVRCLLWMIHMYEKHLASVQLVNDCIAASKKGNEYKFACLKRIRFVHLWGIRHVPVLPYTEITLYILVVHVCEYKRIHW